MTVRFPKMVASKTFDLPFLHRAKRSCWRTLVTASLPTLIGAVVAMPVAQAIEPFPRGVRVEEIKVNGTALHVRVGGTGPAVVMLHGFADTGDMWAPLAAAMISTHT